MSRVADQIKEVLAGLDAQLDTARVVNLVADAGTTYTPTQSDDPIARWIDLIEVVEALCPSWPERESFVAGPFVL